MTLSVYRKLIRQGMLDIGIDQSYGPYSLKHAAINKLFSLGLELAQVDKVARYVLNSTMVLAHYNPTSTNEKALQLLSSTNSIEKQPIQLEKKPIYEESSITQEEDNYKILFEDDQEIEKIVKEIQEKEQKQKEDHDLIIKQEQELAKEKILNLKQQLLHKNSKSKSTSTSFKNKVKEKIQEIKELDSENKKTQHSNTFSSEDSFTHSLTHRKTKSPTLSKNLTRVTHLFYSFCSIVYLFVYSVFIVYL
jgi:hypothetical protein